MRLSITLIATIFATIVLQTWARPDTKNIFGGAITDPTDAVEGEFSGGISGGLYDGESGGVSGGISSGFYGGIDLGEVFGGFEGFQGERRDDAELITNYLVQAQQVSENVYDDLSENSDEFRKPLQRLIRLVNYQLKGLRSTTKRLVLTSIVQQLQELNDDIESLIQRAEEVRLRQSQQITDLDQTVLRRWNVWADVILLRATRDSNNNQEIIEQSESLINEYVNRYSNYLQVCANEVEYEQQEFEDQIKKGIETYQPVFESLVDPLLHCLREADSKEVGIRCESQIRSQLTALKTAHEEALKLLAQSNELLNSQYKRRYCVIETVIQFSLERYEIEGEIELAIARASEGSGAESGGAQSGSDNSSGGDQSGSGDSFQGDASSSDDSSQGNPQGSGDVSQGNPSGSGDSSQGNPQGPEDDSSQGDQFNEHASDGDDDSTG